MNAKELVKLAKQERDSGMKGIFIYNHDSTLARALFDILEFDGDKRKLVTAKGTIDEIYQRVTGKEQDKYRKILVERPVLILTEFSTPKNTDVVGEITALLGAKLQGKYSFTFLFSDIHPDRVSKEWSAYLDGMLKKHYGMLDFKTGKITRMETELEKLAQKFLEAMKL